MMAVGSGLSYDSLFAIGHSTLFFSVNIYEILEIWFDFMVLWLVVVRYLIFGDVE